MAGSKKTKKNKLGVKNSLVNNINAKKKMLEIADVFLFFPLKIKGKFNFFGHIV